MLELYTDGGCVRPNGPGGWAFVLIDHTLDTPSIQRNSGGTISTTNNRMELTAVLQGLAALTNPSDVLVISDSRYVVDGIEKWLPTWIRRGWKRSGGAVANQDLWQLMHEFITIHRVQVLWVRGHTGNRYNEECDKLASEAMHVYLERETYAVGKSK